ncbi:hypothetical protein BVRB_1g014690 [Beta vulgaris subsp. vulgaris]|nr:hypothetical protein BVRB_1g014690 [Beta vulgaris subsp. vulgaris]
MIYKIENKRQLLAKPRAAGGRAQMKIYRHRSMITKREVPAGGSDAFKGLALVLHGIQDLCDDKMRKQQMMEILIRRALSPPPKRLTLRWRNFRPTPSRLSMMSTP